MKHVSFEQIIFGMDMIEKKTSCEEIKLEKNRIIPKNTCYVRLPE